MRLILLLSYRFSVIIILLGVLGGIASAFPEGPPLSACVSMLPGTKTGDSGVEGHDALPQNQFSTFGRSVSPPYSISTTAINSTYHPGVDIDGELKALY